MKKEEKMKLRRILVICLVGLFLVSCAHNDDTRRKLNEVKWEVIPDDNTFLIKLQLTTLKPVPIEKITKALLIKAASVATEHNYPYFIVYNWMGILGYFDASQVIKELEISIDEVADYYFDCGVSIEIECFKKKPSNMVVYDAENLLKQINKWSYK